MQVAVRPKPQIKRKLPGGKTGNDSIGDRIVGRSVCWALAAGLLLGCCVGPGAAEGSAAAAPAGPIPLQPLIDATPAGQTLVLSGERPYAGPAVVSAAISIVSAEGAVVTNMDERPALTLAADGVVLEGVEVVDGRRDPKTPAVLIRSDRNELRRVVVKTSGGGIFLRNADDNVIADSRIEGANAGDRSEPYSKRGNGIDLLASSGNVIEGNTIVHVHDGVYVESGNETLVRGNRATDSRYGFHFMFSGKPELVGNVGEGNVTGGMVMGVESAVVTGNVFEKQTENVHSQGILLFDVHRSEVSGNRVAGNRVGFYIENSTENTLADNEIAQNFIGMQMIGSTGNELRSNVFVANVNQAQSTDSKDNSLAGNYWDDFQALDSDGDGYSDLSYEIDPFFLQITKDIDAFQIFFQTPGLPFLAQMFHADTADWLKDPSPLLRSPPTALVTSGAKTADSRRWTWLPGGVLLAGAILIIYRWGYRKT